ncbi:hypothetical protein GCM10010472_52180 [Pseudonocardia halophobica]|uniref:Uncharacterized protein n=1 Tax=Pseudonocardia halophobica TaxID=29401 RepID=A0A9W6NVZ3_9PSEU|nr:hypothetical protein GCM10017577_24950 [Pseudonocardia halophobica]
MTTDRPRPTPSHPVPDGVSVTPSPVPPYGDGVTDWRTTSELTPSRTEEVYIGGPLDGQPARPHRGRWPIWRHEDGTPVATAAGDREFLGHDRHTYPPFYVDLDQTGRPVHSSTLVPPRCR